MWYQLLIALGSGLASAVLFLLPAKGSLAALFFGVLAPLPIMIAALGFGPRSAGIAAAAGCLLIGIVLHPYLAGAFFCSAVVPAVLLGWLSLRATLAPIATDDEAQTETKAAPGVVWTSPTALLSCMILLSIGMDFAGIGLMALRYDSFDAAVNDFATRFAPMVSRLFGPDEVPGGYTSVAFARLLVIAMAPIAAGWGVIALAVNLWLAGRVTQISGRLRRPWPDLPSTLAMPRAAIYVLALALGATLVLGDLARIMTATIAAAIAVGFALHGLAALHGATRGMGARAGILTGAYAVVFALFPWPLLLIAVIGIADLFHPLRPITPPVIHPPINRK